MKGDIKMNRHRMINYILAWEGDTEETQEKLDAMTNLELEELFKEYFNEFQGMVPPPDDKIDPSDYLHLPFNA